MRRWAGQHIRIQMWNGDVVVQDGILEPDGEIELTFRDGAQLVTHFSLTRMNADEVARYETVHPPVAVF